MNLDATPTWAQAQGFSFPQEALPSNPLCLPGLEHGVVAAVFTDPIALPGFCPYAGVSVPALCQDEFRPHLPNLGPRLCLSALDSSTFFPSSLQVTGLSLLSSTLYIKLQLDFIVLCSSCPCSWWWEGRGPHGLSLARFRNLSCDDFAYCSVCVLDSGRICVFPSVTLVFATGVPVSSVHRPTPQIGPLLFLVPLFL